MTSADLEQARREFARRIQAGAVLRSSALVDGLSTVPREDFVGPGPWKILRPAEMSAGYQMTPDADPRHIYDTVLVALDPARGLNNGEPSSLLLFLDMLDLAPGDRFLHIGCGVGYYTAIAAHAVLPNGRVIGLEVDRQLADRAKRNLQRYENAEIICIDGNEFTDGPFDAIFVNAGVTDIHSAWLDQLAEGGRVLIPMTIAFPDGRAAGLPADVAALFGEIGGGYTLLVTRRRNRYLARFASPVAVFHCAGARSTEGETILGEALKRGGQADVRSLRRDQHSADTECWLHGTAFCLSRSAV